MPADVCVECADANRAESYIQLLENVGEELLRACAVSDRELSILLTDDPGIQALNAQWRGVDAPTDVLSFAFDEVDQHAEWMPLGDIVLNLDRADTQRHDHGLSLEQELIYLLIHGFCHLRGFDHAEPEEAAHMKAEEERLVGIVGLDAQRPQNFF